MRNNLSKIESSPSPRQVGLCARMLVSRDFDIIRHFLLSDLAPNLFMLSWLENYGVLTPGRKDLFQWVGVFDEKLLAIALLINQRLLMLSAPSLPRSAKELHILASHFGEYESPIDHIVARLETVDGFWEVYQDFCPPPRLRREQKFLSLFPKDLFPINDEEPTLRFAEKKDLNAVFLASAAMHVEESLDNPLDKNPDQFRRHIERRIENRRTFVAYDAASRLVFKADISAQASAGSQISGIYVPPSMRRKGHAKKGLYELCAYLFSEGTPQLTLYVNADNQPARMLYEGLGFQGHCDFLSVFVV